MLSRRYRSPCGDDAPREARDLIGSERRVRELCAQVEDAEQVHDVVHPLVEVGPVARAAVVGGGRNRFETREQLFQLRV